MLCCLACSDYLCVDALMFSHTCRKSTPDNATSSPVPPLMPLSLSSDFASDLAAELFPLHSGEQLPLGLLGDDDSTPSMPLYMYMYMQWAIYVHLYKSQAR